MSRFRWLLVNAALAAFLVGLLPGLVAAGNGIGAALQLGKNNTVAALTKLTAATVNAALQIQNTGGGPGLQITVGAGKAPITVSAGAGKATNLNADMLDGKDSTGFQNKLQSLGDLAKLPCGAGNAGRLLVADFSDGVPIRCVFGDTEPNDTTLTANEINQQPQTKGGFAGSGDFDYYHLQYGLGCSPSSCVWSASVLGTGVQFDVIRNGTTIQTGVTAYSEFFSYSGSPPQYYLKVYVSPDTGVVPYMIFMN